jgi:hypothetical protein
LEAICIPLYPAVQWEITVDEASNALSYHKLVLCMDMKEKTIFHNYLPKPILLIQDMMYPSKDLDYYFTEQ